MRQTLIGLVLALAAGLLFWPQTLARAEMIECIEYNSQIVGPQSGVLATSHCAVPKLVNACVRVQDAIGTMEQGQLLVPGNSWFFYAVNFDRKPSRFTIAVCNPSKVTTRRDLCMPACPAQFRGAQTSQQPAGSGVAKGRGREAAPLNPGDWITGNDYPARAMVEGRSGMTRVSYTVLASGAVANCRVVSSSGSADLDAATCTAITTRARYSPATDAAGRPVASTVTKGIRWTVP